MPKFKSTSQAPTKQQSPTVNFAVGSGSRPTPSKIKIPSSAPSNPKMHRT